MPLELAPSSLQLTYSHEGHLIFFCSFSLLSLCVRCWGFAFEHYLGGMWGWRGGGVTFLTTGKEVVFFNCLFYRKYTNPGPGRWRGRNGQLLFSTLLHNGVTWIHDKLKGCLTRARQLCKVFLRLLSNKACKPCKLKKDFLQYRIT
jgi:hypothetical protein